MSVCSTSVSCAYYLAYFEILGVTSLRGRGEGGDDFEEGIVFEINDMTASDFQRRIQNFHGEVIRAWNEDQRVKAIKIVIQVI